MMLLQKAAAVAILVFLVSTALPIYAQKAGRRLPESPRSIRSGDEQIPGVTSIGVIGIPRITAEIMDSQFFAAPIPRPFIPRRLTTDLGQKGTADAVMTIQRRQF